MLKYVLRAVYCLILGRLWRKSQYISAMSETQGGGLIREKFQSNATPRRARGARAVVKSKSKEVRVWVKTKSKEVRVRVKTESKEVRVQVKSKSKWDGQNSYFLQNHILNYW